VGRFIRDTSLLTVRSLRAIPRVPERLLDVTIQPIVFILLFLYVFGSAIHVPGVSYKDYLFPGIIAQSLAFGIIGAGVATSHDMTEGVIDRFRSMPISRLSIITAQVMGQFCEQLLGLTIVVVFGLILGWEPHLTAPHTIELIALMVLGMFAFTWMGVLLGMLVRSPDAMQGVGFIVIFPLAFLAGTFVPIAGMDAVPRAIAQWDPISALVGSVRGLTEGVHTTGSWQLVHPELAMALWCLLIIAVCVQRREIARSGGLPRGRFDHAVACPPLPEHDQRPVDDAVGEHLAVVEPRELRVGSVDLEKLAQRLPALADVPHEQAFVGDVPLDLLLVAGDRLSQLSRPQLGTAEDALGGPHPPHQLHVGMPLGIDDLARLGYVRHRGAAVEHVPDRVEHAPLPRFRVAHAQHHLRVRMGVCELPVEEGAGPVDGRLVLPEDRVPIGVDVHRLRPLFGQRQVRQDVDHVVAGAEPEHLERRLLRERAGARQPRSNHLHVLPPVLRSGSATIT
jgi:ABC-2 type transport system permease protein